VVLVGPRHRGHHPVREGVLDGVDVVAVPGVERARQPAPVAEAVAVVVGQRAARRLHHRVDGVEQAQVAAGAEGRQEAGQRWRHLARESVQVAAGGRRGQRGARGADVGQERLVSGALRLRQRAGVEGRVAAEGGGGQRGRGSGVLGRGRLALGGGRGAVGRRALGRRRGGAGRRRARLLAGRPLLGASGAVAGVGRFGASGACAASRGLRAPFAVVGFVVGPVVVPLVGLVGRFAGRSAGARSGRAPAAGRGGAIAAGAVLYLA